MIVYSQNDSKWKSEKLGFSATSTIGRYGCLVATYAQLATYYGKNINPSQMNQLFKDKNCFVDGSYLKSSNVLALVYPDIRYLETTFLENVQVTDQHIENIRWYLDRGIPVVLKIKTGAGHYVLAIGYDNGIIITDPQDGKIRKISDKYGEDKKVILRIIIYEGKKQKMALLSQGLVVDTKGKAHLAIGFANVVKMNDDRSQTLVTATFPDGNKWEQWINTEELIVVNTSEELQKKIDEANKQMDSLKKEIETLRAEVKKATKYWEEWKEKAGNYQEEIKKIEGSLGAVEVIILQMLQLFNEE